MTQQIRSILLTALLFGLLTVAAVAPAQAQIATTWQGQYYNSPTLEGPAVFTRDDAAIAFNWQRGSPGEGINVDNFSVRWGTDIELPAGTYRFYARADDHVRVIVNFQNTPLIETFGTNRVGQLVSGDIQLEAGTHHIQVDYQELSLDAYVNVWFENINNVGGGIIEPLPPSTGLWRAEYFANTNLVGNPVLVQSENNPNGNWGQTAPAVGVPADNWSARWSRSQYLNSGSYRLDVRADDGIRVSIDGNLIINEWHLADGQTHSAAVNLDAGYHNIVVEYYENDGSAYVDYNFNLGSVIPPPEVSGPSATVITDRLNLRTAPSIATGQIITRINRGETYPLLARNTAETWAQINVDGSVGWVNDNFVDLHGAAQVPELGPEQPPVIEGPIATVDTGLLNVRDLPNPFSGDVITQIANGETYPLLAHNPLYTWVLLDVNGTRGWVNRSYVNLENVSGVPVADGSQPGLPPIDNAAPMLTATFTVNLRSGPGISFPDLGNLPFNASAEIIGRTGDNSWWQVRYGGQSGWVFNAYVSLDSGIDIDNIPITGQA